MPTNNSNERIRVSDQIKICKRGKNGIYTADFSLDGEHRRRSLKTSNRKIAMAKARELEAQLVGGAFPVKPSNLSITDAISQYLTFKRHDGCRPRTLIKYHTELNNFADFAASHRTRYLHQISLVLHDRYRQERLETLTQKTVYNHVVILQGFLKWCARRKMIVENPLTGVENRKPISSRAFAPTIKQVESLLAAAANPLTVKLMSLAFTGMRSGELQHLRPEDVDLTGGWIRIQPYGEWRPKTGEGRNIPIHPRLLVALQAMRKRQCPYFFCAAPSRQYADGCHHISTRHLNVSLRRLATSLGIPVGRKNGGMVIHSLRHFFETTCVNAAIPQPVIDTWMGHTGDRSMGRLYFQLSELDSQRFMKTVPFDKGT